MTRTTFLLLTLACIFITESLPAEVPLMSPDELKSQASHIVVGKVRAVYSTTGRSEDWEDTDNVAEISVANVEKGPGVNSGDVIYAHYWNKNWIGKGDAEPHSSGHSGVTKGQFVIAYLQRKEGTFQVMLPNGFDLLEPDQAKTVSPTAMLQGTWNFAYYLEKGVVQEPGTKQFVIKGSELHFRAGGETRVETIIEVQDGELDQKFSDGQVYPSIFKRVGDLLIICGNRNKDRPTAFAGGTENEGEFLIVLHRE